jgi:hypothetical protein
MIYNEFSEVVQNTSRLSESLRYSRMWHARGLPTAAGGGGGEAES